MHLFCSYVYLYRLSAQIVLPSVCGPTNYMSYKSIRGDRIFMKGGYVIRCSSKVVLINFLKSVTIPT